MVLTCTHQSLLIPRNNVKVVAWQQIAAQKVCLNTKYPQLDAHTVTQTYIHYSQHSLLVYSDVDAWSFCHGGLPELDSVIIQHRQRRRQQLCISIKIQQLLQQQPKLPGEANPMCVSYLNNLQATQ